MAPLPEIPFSLPPEFHASVYGPRPHYDEEFPDWVLDPLPPPQNPDYVEVALGADHVDDDAYPDPPFVPAGWVHVPSAGEVRESQIRDQEFFPRTEETAEEEGAEGDEAPFPESGVPPPSPPTGGSSKALAESAARAARRAVPAAAWAAEKTAAAASSAALAAREINEKYRVVDRTMEAAKSAAGAMRSYGEKTSAEERLGNGLGRGLSARIELAKRRSRRGNDGRSL